MKKQILIALALCLLLQGCGTKNPTPSETQSGTAAVTPPETVPTVPTTEPETVPTEPEVTEPEVTEPVIVYRHPLNGQVLDAPYTGRPTAVVVNNLKQCLPQYGISDADMIYEIETEAGVTRFLAIYTDLEQVAAIGPVRSLRTFHTSIAASYNAPSIHCGGSVKGRKGMYDSKNKLKNWEHIDFLYNPDFFYRDKDRKAQGYATEHTLFTTGELLLAGLAQREYLPAGDTEVSYGLEFSETVLLDGEAAGAVTVTFKNRKTTTFTLDTASGLYKASQYKQDHIDAATGEVMSYRNLIILQTKQKMSNDGEYNRSYYTLEGQGEGYFACGGQMVPILWSRESVNDPFAYTLTDGTPLTLGVGKSYVAVIDTSGSAGVSCS